MMNRGWMLLACFGLMSAGAADCLAAEPPQPQAPAERVPPAIEPARVREKEAAAKAAAAAAQAAAAAKAAAAAGHEKAVQASKPAAPPNQVSLLDALVGAMGGENAAQAQKQREAAAEQNRRNIEAQYRPQFEQMLYAELAFFRRVCKPDANQFLEVAKAAKADIHTALREFAVSMTSPRAVPAGQAQPADQPRAAVQKQLLSLAEAKLGPEKARLYRQECDKLAELRRHSVIMNVVASLDERLVLSPRQRDKLVESLSPKYDSSWEAYCEIYTSNPQYWPSIPDPLIVPLLDERQKGIWQQAMKPSFGRMIRSGSQFGGADEIQEIARMVAEVKDGP
jgi:hypothetical protein